MNNNDFLQIGYISKLHGYRGELKIKPSSVVLIQPQDIKHILLQNDSGATPYKIEQLSASGETYVIKLVGINSDVDAKPLIGCTCSVNKEFAQINETEAMANELVGFEVIDATHGTIGRVKELDVDGPQALLYITHPSAIEIIIPFIPQAIILNIDPENKQIQVNCPDGLLAVYLEGNEGNVNLN